MWQREVKDLKECGREYIGAGKFSWNPLKHIMWVTSILPEYKVESGCSVLMFFSVAIVPFLWPEAIRYCISALMKNFLEIK